MATMNAERNTCEKIFNITRDRMWADGLGEAFDEAKATGKFVLIATGAEPKNNWKLGVALAFMETDMLALSRKFHCVMVNDSRSADRRLATRPTIMICAADGAEIVSATADTMDELIPALRGMLEHVAAVSEPAKRPARRAAPTVARLSVRHFFGTLAHAILGA